MGYDMVKHLIFPKSKFGDFKRMTYWHSLIWLLLKLIYAILSYFSILIGATLK